MERHFQYAQYLERTFSPDLNVRQEAESFLERKSENHAVFLLNVVDGKDLDDTIAAAIAFKIFIEKNWNEQKVIWFLLSAKYNHFLLLAMLLIVLYYAFSCFFRTTIRPIKFMKWSGQQSNAVLFHCCWNHRQPSKNS